VNKREKEREREREREREKGEGEAEGESMAEDKGEREQVAGRRACGPHPRASLLRQNQ